MFASTIDVLLQEAIDLLWRSDTSSGLKKSRGGDSLHDTIQTKKWVPSIRYEH